jgi:sterol desaturase/sphingolipid hydroxylase (fatty acid hydroxylase superfamily)
VPKLRTRPLLTGGRVYGWARTQAHHTHHHSKFNYNYGQFFTFWDTWGGTYLAPSEAVKRDEERIARTKGKSKAS